MSLTGGTAPPDTSSLQTNRTETPHEPEPIHKEGDAVIDTGLQARAQAIASSTSEKVKRNFVLDSHELALEDTDIKGAVQKHEELDAEGSVRDIGWHQSTAEVPDPLIGGLSNGKLWAMIRRFNKDVFDVRAVPIEVVSGLDLNEAWDEDYSTDKLTLNLQRLYLSVVLGIASLAKQVSRLRSWNETRRTTAFCVAYFAAWATDLLIPLVLGTLVVVVTSEQARNILFPPAPRALVSIESGNIQKPQAGELGTFDTLTGAPEKQEGEALEEEAASFVDNLRHIVMRAVGMHDNEEQEGNPVEQKVPKPIRNAIKAIKTEGSAPGHATDGAEQTQKPMEELLWSKVQPKIIAPVVKNAPHLIGEMVDNWERFANAIAPTTPFSKLSFLRIHGILVPLFLMSLFISYYTVYKVVGLAIGLGVFGDPVISPFFNWLNRKCPNWMVLLEPKNNILRGVPTNSQLTLTLLRIGEAHKTPIPPVPASNPDDPDHQKPLDVDGLPFDASRTQILDAAQPSSEQEAGSGSKVGNDEKNEPKHKHASRFIRLFKGHSKAAAETKLAADHVRAAMGSEKAKGHLGVLPMPKNLVYAGPSKFKSRFNGRKGWASITESDIPYLTFTSEQGGDGTDSDTVLKIEVKNIKVLKRAAAFVSKAAEMASDFSTEKKLLGSIEIDDQSGKTWRLTALPERDELFNRLVAIGNQRWENR